MQALSNLLFPLFEPLGVSQADLEMYLGAMAIHLAVICVALVAMIVVMIVAQKAKKGMRHIIRWQAGLAFLLVVTVVVNLICYGPVYNNVSVFLNAERGELSQETVNQSKDIARRVGEEGMVLLKNNGLLPLGTSVDAVNVFGWDSVNPLFGGTGSGSADASAAVGFLQSLQDAGYKTNESLSNMYTEYQPERPRVSMRRQDWTLPEPTVDYYTDALMSEAKAFSDVAVIVLGRSGGEGSDLPHDMYAVINGTYSQTGDSVNPEKYPYTNAQYTNNGDYNDFDPGESYLELSNTEEAMIEKVCSEFDKVIVVINANNTMELGWTQEYDQIGAVILAPGGGSTGFAALGEILNGSVNPSGRTVDTYVADLMSTPYIKTIGNHSYRNVDDLKHSLAGVDVSYEGTLSFINYVEGIYVGYKFYETAYAESVAGNMDFDYDQTVVYPFGYGLSYTTFNKAIDSFQDNGDSISLSVTVTNTGNMAGKDVVELYFTPPYNNGGIEKSAVNLVAFEKTDLLEPGKSQKIDFTIQKEDMASYDSEGIKISGGGYILEAGEYTISLRSDAHTVIAEKTFTVASDIDYSKTGRASDFTVATNQFQDYARGKFTQLSRADGFANYDEACGDIPDSLYVMDDETRDAVTANSLLGYDGTKFNNDSDPMPAVGAKNGLVLYDLRGKDYDDPDWEKLLDQMSLEEMYDLINAGGWQTGEVKSVGKVATNDCDGPAGVHNSITGVNGTAYPAAVLLSQTWNKQLAYDLGVAMGQEFAETKNFGCYGPGLNTHRSAFCGRNFEYYSEDGVLAGNLAAYEVNGADTKGVYTYIKHFALNDQETNRNAFLLTFASEQAIREIYLKPFELAVKKFEGKAQAAMSAYNFIGTITCTANSYLLNNVLRDEWGFVGMVISDYNGGYAYMMTENSFRNGNDLMLGMSSPEGFALGGVLNVPVTSLTDRSATAALAMRQACKNIMFTVVNSGNYADGDPTAGISRMNMIFITVDVIVAAAIIAVEVVLFLRLKKKKTEGQ